MVKIRDLGINTIPANDLPAANRWIYAGCTGDACQTKGDRPNPPNCAEASRGTKYAGGFDAELIEQFQRQLNDEIGTELIN